MMTTEQQLEIRAEIRAIRNKAQTSRDEAQRIWARRRITFLRSKLGA